MSDPKLLAAMEEIQEILKKNDIAGHVVLCSCGHMEYMRHVTTSWTALSVEQVGGRPALRFRCKQAEYPDKATWKKFMTQTIGVLAGFVDVLTSDRDSYLGLLTQLRGKVDFNHVTKEIPPPNSGN